MVKEKKSLKKNPGRAELKKSTKWKGFFNIWGRMLLNFHRLGSHNNFNMILEWYWKTWHVCENGWKGLQRKGSNSTEPFDGHIEKVRHLWSSESKRLDSLLHSWASSRCWMCTSPLRRLGLTNHTHTQNMEACSRPVAKEDKFICTSHKLNSKSNTGW